MEEEKNLKSQIFLMLDQVLDEGNTDKLNFSDNENDSTTSFKECNNFQCLNSPSVQSTQEMKMLSFDRYQRMEKKFGTISFNNNNIPLFNQVPLNQKPYFNTIKSNNYCNSPMGCRVSMYPMQCSPLMFSLEMNQPQNTSFHQSFVPLSPKIHSCYNNPQNNKYQRSNIRKNTYDCNKEMCQSNQSVFSSSSFAPNKFKNNYNAKQEENKFGTTALPAGTDMKTEMLIYELNNVHVKPEKIDNHIFSKLQGHFVDIIKTHKGSKTIQNFLKNTHSEIIHQIFLEINPCFHELMSDPYANFFCKQFFIFLNQKDRIDLLVSIKDSLVQLSIDSIGTYPIQGIIEQVGSKIEKKIIITAIESSLKEVCLDTYGTHVIEKIICCFEEELISFIYDYVSNNFLSLANHINGICVVKKILTLTHKKDLHDKLKSIILANQNAFGLIQHSYGNYVIQVIVECWDESEIREILNQFDSKYTILSMQKYSSNVVERCIEKTPDILDKYVSEICSSGRIAEVMKNNFGNYVIQKALKISSGKAKVMFVESIVNNIKKLNDRKLIAKWKLIVSPHIDKDSSTLLVNSDLSSPKKNKEEDILE